MTEHDALFVARPAGSRWVSRTGYANLVRAAVAVGPLVVGMWVSFGASRVLPPTQGPVAFALRWLLLGAVAFLVVRLVDGVARRFLPLAALLDLSLTFPDAAPSRIRMALDRPSEYELQRRVDHVRQHGLSPEPAEAAEQVLQLVAGLSQHDRITRGHAERVRGYTRLIAEEMGLPDEQIDQLQWAGLLHDIGKIAIPASILNKPGALTSDEVTIMRTHPIEGAAIVEPLKDWLGEALLAVSQHHERWDGGGYPYGISGTDISLAARIVSVADVFDVITARRSYKDARSPAEARQELVRCAGTQFDGDVVRAFLNVSLRKVWWMVGPISWVGQVPAMASMPSIQGVGAGLANAGGTAAVAVAMSAPGAITAPPANAAVDSWAERLTADVRIIEGAPTDPAGVVAAGSAGDVRSADAPGRSADAAGKSGKAGKAGTKQDEKSGPATATAPGQTEEPKAKDAEKPTPEKATTEKDTPEKTEATKAKPAGDATATTGTGTESSAPVSSAPQVGGEETAAPTDEKPKGRSQTTAPGSRDAATDASAADEASPAPRTWADDAELVAPSKDQPSKAGGRATAETSPTKRSASGKTKG